MGEYRNSKPKEHYQVEPRNRDPLPQGPPDLKKSIRYLREKCEPLRGVPGAIAAYHVLVVLDAMDRKTVAPVNPGLKKKEK